MIVYTLWLLFALFLLQTCVLVYLLTIKKQRISTEKEVAHHYEEWYDPFFAYITGTSEEEPSPDLSRPMKVRTVEKILNELIDHHKESIRESRFSRLAGRHLNEPYRLYLKNGSWSQRVNTLYFIEEFHMKDLQEDVMEHIQSLQHYDEEFRQSLRTLASFEETRLIPIMLEDTRLSQRMIKELLRRFPISVIHQLTEAMEHTTERLPHPLQLAVVAYCGEVKAERLLPFIEKRLLFPNKEIRLKALRAIADYGMITDPALLDGFFTSDHWEERMLASKITGRLHLEEYRDVLHTLAGDREWWVRYAALEALRHLPEGDRLLLEASTRHEDRYARDMAARLLTMEVSR